MSKQSALKMICVMVVIMIAATTTICPAAGIDDKFLRSIKNSGHYYFGEGSGQTEDDARRQAKVTLLESITVAIASRTTDISREDNFEVSEDYESVVKTYSSLSLQNLQTRVDESRDGWYAISYISKSDLEASFIPAKQKVRDMVNLALQAESEGRIGDALKMLYWAYLLTHTYVGELDLGLEGIEVVDAGLAISENMQRIVGDLVVEAEPCYRKASSTGTSLSFFYHGQPVQNLEFGYQCGDGDDFGYIMKGSSETITLFHPITTHIYPLWLGIEYKYLREMSNRPEILNLYDIFKEKQFDLNICVNLTVPWIAAAGNNAAQKPEPAAKPPSELVQKGWSTTIEVLADITDRQEFDAALYDYHHSGRVIVAGDRAQISRDHRIFIAILDQSRKLELLYLNNNTFKSVKSGKFYKDYHEAYSGEAMVIWIGETPK